MVGERSVLLNRPCPATWRKSGTLYNQILTVIIWGTIQDFCEVRQSAFKSDGFSLDVIRARGQTYGSMVDELKGSRAHSVDGISSTANSQVRMGTAIKLKKGL